MWGWVARSFQHGIEISVSIKGGNAMQLREYQLVHEQCRILDTDDGWC